MTTEALISAASIGGNLLLTWFNTKWNKQNQTLPYVNNTVIVSLLDDSHRAKLDVYRSRVHSFDGSLITGLAALANSVLTPPQTQQEPNDGGMNRNVTI